MIPGSAGSGRRSAPSQFDRRRYKVILHATGLIAIIVILIQFNTQVAGYRRNLAEATRITDAIARVVEDQTQRTLQTISLVLDTTPPEFEGRRKLDQQALKERIRSIPEIRGLFLVGLDGIVVDSTLSPADIGQDVGDMDFIVKLNGAGTPSTVIGKPVMRRSLSGPPMPAQAFLPLAMLLPDAAGYLVAAVNISYLQIQHQSLLKSSEVAVSLLGFDGTVLMDAQGTWSLGLDLGRLDPIFTDYLPGIERATFSRPPVAGKSEQLVSFRVTRAFPVVVVAAIDIPVIRRRWFGGMLPDLLLTFAAICLVLFALVHMRRQLGHMADQEADVRASRDAAEAASKAKSQFLAVMSHEVRTPMNAVLGLSTLLLEEPLTTRQRARVRSIHDAGEGLLVLLNDILEYSRLEAGEIALDEAPFDPDAHLRSALDIITPLARAKGLAVHSIVADDLPAAVIGDAGRLRQVLINVASNAIKFTSDGLVAVELACRLDGAGAVTLAWTVRDTGLGIEPERIESVFREFVQADSTIQRRFGGSGLGLSICRRIMDRMGGAITLTSEPGAGTCVEFSVTLPVADGTVLATSDDSGAAGELEAAIGRLGAPLRLLVVDDNKTNHVVTAGLLHGFAIGIDHAYDGTEGLRAARREAYHVILMDTQMPGLDGLAATRAIRASDGPSRAAHVIAFTANAMREDVEAARAAGSDDVVTKPVRKRELLRALLRAFAAEDRPAEAPAADVAAEAEPTPVPFDGATFRALAEDIGDDGIEEIVVVFLEETETRLARLSAPHPAAPGDVAREAHTLKSGAAMLGLALMAREAAELEQAAAAGSFADLGDRVERIRSAYRAGLAQLPGADARRAA